MSWTGERCRVYWKQRREAANGKLMGFGAYKQRRAAITSARLARPPLEMPQRCTAEAEAEAKAAAEVDQTLNTAIIYSLADVYLGDLTQCILSEGIPTEP